MRKDDNLTEAHVGVMGRVCLRSKTPIVYGQHLNHKNWKPARKLESKDKGEVIPVEVMKAYSESRGIASLILTLATTLRSIVNFTPLPFYPRERTPVPTEYVAGWASQPV